MLVLLLGKGTRRAEPTSGMLYYYTKSSHALVQTGVNSAGPDLCGFVLM